MVGHVVVARPFVRFGRLENISVVMLEPDHPVAAKLVLKDFQPAPGVGAKRSVDSPEELQDHESGLQSVGDRARRQQ